MRIGILVLLTLTLLAGRPATPEARSEVARPGFDVDILVDGAPIREYAARGRQYVEALEGKEYEIRLRNPLGVRVAVALSVDGLNTIDARRTSAQGARKWVLEPYETVTISGWQTGRGEARRFYFTTEAKSYGQWLGQTEHLGTISAVFFRERVPVPITRSQRPESRVGQGRSREAQGSNVGADAAAPPSAAGPAPSTAPAAKDAYAATGIGRPMEHRVEEVYLDLVPTAVAAIDLRYEFRPQLVKLGIVPERRHSMTRREGARGFDGPYAPVPPQ